MMAAPRGRGRPVKTNAQAEQLSAALAFVSVASVKDETLECAPYVQLGNKMAVVFSRQMSAGFPIAEDLNLCPHLEKLTAALARCGKTLTLAQTPAGALSVSGDKLRAVVPCWAEAIPLAEPDPAVAVIDERIREAFRVCNSLASEAGESVIEASLLLEANTCTSTNRFVLLQFWHGIDLPPHIVVPKVFAAAVCKVEKPVTGFGFTWDYNLGKPGRITIWFEGGAWLSCQCYSDRWQDISHIIDAPSYPIETPTGFFEAAEAVSNFSDDKMPSVYLAENKLMSHNTPTAGAQYDVAGIQAGKRFSAEFLKKIASYATMIDLTTYVDKLYFRNTDAKAPVRGTVMGMTGGVVAERKIAEEPTGTAWGGAEITGDDGFDPPQVEDANENPGWG